MEYKSCVSNAANISYGSLIITIWQIWIYDRYEYKNAFL